MGNEDSGLLPWGDAALHREAAGAQPEGPRAECWSLTRGILRVLGGASSLKGGGLPAAAGRCHSGHCRRRLLGL